MKIYLNLILSSFFVASFFSCAANYNAYDGEKGGYVVGAISVKDVAPRFDAYQVKYQSSKEEPGYNYSSVMGMQSAYMTWFSKEFDPDVWFDDVATIYFAQRLKPGKYYISFFEKIEFSAYMETKHISEIYYPFEVKENEITYIGDFYYDSRFGDYFEINDKSARDIKEIDKIYPGLKKYPVKEAAYKYLKHH